MSTLAYTLAHKIVRKLIKKPPKTRQDIAEIKRTIAGAFKLPLPSNAALISAYRKLLTRHAIGKNTKLEELLVKREVRTLSGVAIVTLLTKPFPCPGKCVYCPTEIRMPKSYIETEPACQRALKLAFDPYRQTLERIKTLEQNGHPVDKIELIVKGGTWSAYPWNYRLWFIRRSFEAANDAAGRKYSYNNTAKKEREENRLLIKAQTENEHARHRIVGLTLETRPDWVKPEEIKRLRLLGCTRVEIGLQSTYDDVLKLVKRGHNIDEVKRASRLLRNAGFKVDFHTMPQLPGSTPARDLKMYKTLFNDPDLRPDMIKIYPCVVLPNAELYSWWKEGNYSPYKESDLIEVLVKAKQLIPYYCRVSRIIRDIPGPEIAAGNTVTNLREIIQRIMAKRGLKCKCLRCREIGHLRDNVEWKMENAELFVDEYEASGGTEYFLSFEDKKRQAVLAFLRLRLPGKSQSNEGQKLYSLLPEIRGAAFIRELHTYGHLLPLKDRLPNSSSAHEVAVFHGRELPPLNRHTVQHTGLGRKLMEKAETIATKNGYKKMAVIAGVGVRQYYRKLNYRKTGTYMLKQLK